MPNYRKEARDRDCEIRIPGYCNGDPQTSCLCHINGGGMGTKQDDQEAAIGCSACHDIVDFRKWTEFSREQIQLWHHEGAMRTRDIWRREGKL